MVKVDQDKCIGCGLCTTTCPNVFELGESGKSIVKDPEGKDCDMAEVIESCPAKAISKEEIANPKS